MTFKQAQAELHAIGISLSHGVGSEKYRVNYLRAGVQAYYTDNLADAIAIGRAMVPGHHSAETSQRRRHR